METVGNYPDLASARVAQSLLDAEGIDSIIPDEYLAGVDWQMGTAIHGVRLQVQAEDADDARGLLAFAEGTASNTSSDEPPSDPADLVCPACGSDSIGEVRWKHRLKAATLLIPVLVILWPLIAAIRPLSLCRSCGHRWKAA